MSDAIDYTAVATHLLRHLRCADVIGVTTGTVVHVEAVTQLVFFLESASQLPQIFRVDRDSSLAAFLSRQTVVFDDAVDNLIAEVVEAARVVVADMGGERAAVVEIVRSVEGEFDELCDVESVVFELR